MKVKDTKLSVSPMKVFLKMAPRTIKESHWNRLKPEHQIAIIMELTPRLYANKVKSANS